MAGTYAKQLTDRFGEAIDLGGELEDIPFLRQVLARLTIFADCCDVTPTTLLQNYKDAARKINVATALMALRPACRRPQVCRVRGNSVRRNRSLSIAQNSSLTEPG